MFRNTNPSPVPGAEFFSNGFILGKRKHAACRENPIASDDNRSIMQGRSLVENVPQQFRGDLRVHNCPRLRHIGQGGFPLQHNQRAGPLF